MDSKQMLEELNTALGEVEASRKAHMQIQRIIHHYKQRLGEAGANGQQADRPQDAAPAKQD